LATGRTSRASRRYFDLLSPDRTRVALVTPAGLTVSRLDGSQASTLARLGDCPDLVDQEFAWLPDGRSLVYEFKCQYVPGDLYTISADGSGLHRIGAPVAEA